MRRHLIATAIVVFVAIGIAEGSSGQTLGQEKTILPMIKANWIAFRDYDGRQFVYFTMLQSYRCGLKEIRFSLDNEDLGEYFPLPPCDPERPNAIDAEQWPPYITMPLGTATWAMVQLVYSDGEISEPARFARCENTGDSACAVLRP